MYWTVAVCCFYGVPGKIFGDSAIERIFMAPSAKKIHLAVVGLLLLQQRRLKVPARTAPAGYLM